MEEEFETQYVPQVFEEIVKQFLIRRNRAGKMPVRIDDIGTKISQSETGRERRRNSSFEPSLGRCVNGRRQPRPKPEPTPL